MGFGSLGAVGAGTAHTASPSFLLDLVTSQSTADAAYGLIKLRPDYTGNCIELRNKQSGVYATKQIGFSLVGGRWPVNVAEANAFDSLRDPGTITEGRFLDQLGNGNDAAITGAHVGFYWGTDAFGNPVLQSVHQATNPGGSSQALTIPATVALNNDSFSAVFIGALNSSWPQSATHIYELANPRTRFFTYANGGGCGFAFGNGGSIAYGSQLAGPGFFANVIGPSQIQTVFNDNSVIAAKPLQSGISSGGTLGWSTNGVTVGGGASYFAMIFFNRTLTPAELALARAWSYENYNTIVRSADTNLIVVGESAAEGYSSNSNQCFPQLLLPLLKKHVNLYVVSTSGFSYTNWASNLNAVIGLLKPNVENIVALFGCCWNEIEQGSTPAQAYATMQTLVSQWRSAAAARGLRLKVIGTGQNQISAGILPTATQNSFWSFLQGDHAFLDGFYDLWSSPYLGGSANISNSAFFTNDGLHPTTPAGHQIIAEGFASALQSLGEVEPF